MASGLIRDFEHVYGGYRRGERAKCRIRIFAGVDWPVVVCSELPDNKGLSVTNGCEYIAAEVIRLDLVTTPLTWIEHYSRRRGDDYDLVTFKTYVPRNVLIGGVWRWTLGEPEWHRISTETATRLANVARL